MNPSFFTGLFVGTLLLIAVELGTIYSSTITVEQTDQTTSDSSSQQPKQEIISSIKIIRHQVLDNSGESDIPSSVTNLVNRLHFLTRESVIRRELLFKEGNAYSHALTEETERNLRRLRFVGKAEITVKRQEPGKVDLVVDIEDRWAIFFSSIAEGGGGLREFGCTVGDFNFLGRGQSLTIATTFGSERNSVQLSFGEPRVFSSRWALTTGFARNSDGRSLLLSLYRPFFALSTAWSAGLSWVTDQRVERLYKNGFEAVEFHKSSTVGSAFITRSSGKSWKKRFSLGYGLDNAAYKPTQKSLNHISAGNGQKLDPQLTPEDEKRSRVTLSFGIVYPRFQKETFIDNYGNVEDLNLGWDQQLTLGRQFQLLGADKNQTYVLIKLREASKLSNGTYISSFTGMRTYLDQGKFTNGIGEENVICYAKIFPRQTLVTRTFGAVGLKLNKSTQFVLGGSNGFRGYRAYRFSGQKLLFLLNLEDRVFIGEVFTTRLGIVTFLDGGNVWQTDQKVRFQDLRWSAGIGLRIGFPKVYDALVSRIDIGWPLDGSRQVFVSFGSGQHFSF